MATGVNAEDERFSWNAALVAMIILSVLASLAFAFNVNPFAFWFNVSFVYLPTVVLIVGPYLARSRSKSS